MNASEFGHRPLDPADLPVLCGFPADAQELFFMFPRASWPLTPEQLERAAAERREPTVFLCGSEVAGYANFLAWAGGDFCEVGNLVVGPAWRRRGLASRIMEVMQDKAREVFAARRFKVSCFSLNTGAMLLYARLGFMPTGIEPRNGPDGVPYAIVKFEKQLCKEAS